MPKIFFMGAQKVSEYWTIPDEISKKIVKKFTGDPKSYLPELKEFIKNKLEKIDEGIWLLYKDKCKEWEDPTRLFRALNLSKEYGIYIKHGKTHFLDLLCFFAFKQNWVDTLKKHRISQKAILTRRAYKHEVSEAVIFTTRNDTEIRIGEIDNVKVVEEINEIEESSVNEINVEIEKKKISESKIKKDADIIKISISGDLIFSEEEKDDYGTAPFYIGDITFTLFNLTKQNIHFTYYFIVYYTTIRKNLKKSFIYFNSQTKGDKQFLHNLEVSRPFEIVFKIDEVETNLEMNNFCSNDVWGTRSVKLIVLDAFGSLVTTVPQEYHPNTIEEDDYTLENMVH